MQSWGGRFHSRFNGASVCHPRSEQEVIDIVTACGRTGGKIKVVGAGHSWSDAFLPASNSRDVIVMRLDCMSELVSVDKARLRVTVEAGMTIKALFVKLREHGLSLPVVGSITEQHIAGAIATATHGSSVRQGNLATLVMGMRIVLASGQMLELHEGKDEGRLQLARVHLGALGVVTRVTLRVERMFYVMERIDRVRLSDVPRQLLAYAESDDFVRGVLIMSY